MKPVFTPSILEKHFQCPNCHWEGKGRDLMQEQFSHEESIELTCPKCDYYFGFINTEADDSAHEH